MEADVSVTESGCGPAVVLVHGGVGPEITWERQQPLAERWRLIIPKRRGFPGSGPAERQDFETDSHDLSRILGDPAHLVGFSYGGVGAALLAAREPDRIRSLSLIESPIYAGAPDHPEVRRIARAGDAFLAGEADETTEREFLANAGVDPSAASGRTAALIREAMEAARGGRAPTEAEVDLDAIATAAFPVMVVSGDHHAGIEALCDGLAEKLGARREIVRGAGHAVPRAPGFNEVLEDFLRSAER
jgi:pimeloyl-ACP methyl ester carboxylesterase